MKKRVTPFVGTPRAFYDHLIREGYYSSDQLQRSIENSTTKDQCIRYRFDIIDQSEEEVQETLHRWVPSNDLKILFLIEQHSIVYIASMLKCSIGVVNQRLNFLFNTTNPLHILKISQEEKDEILKQSLDRYDRWVDNLDFEELVKEFFY